MIFAANLKCNHTRASFSEYVSIIEKANLMEEILIFPPSSAYLMGNFSFTQGAQNFYPIECGSVTGEIGAAMLDEFYIKTVLIGHSERRNLGESDEFLKSKFEFAKSKGYKIIYCIGEDLKTYESKNKFDFLKNQLSFINLNYENLIIAYEPIWAIGSKSAASLDDIEETLNFISTLTSVKLLYGGSVNNENISYITSLQNCSGVLVGRASFDANNFIDLIRNSKC